MYADISVISCYMLRAYLRIHQMWGFSGDLQIPRTDLPSLQDGTVELTEWLDNMPAGTKLRVLQKAPPLKRARRIGMARDGYGIVFPSFFF